MADRKKVVRNLEYLISFGGASKQSMVMQIAVDALALINDLAKQAEVIPDREGATPDIDGGGMTWFFCCGECRHTLQDRWKYCPECGKRVKWT